jgi:hypothetical protein
MRSLFSTSVVFALVSATCVSAAPQITVELATERGLQITAPHEWLQLLASIGIEDVRIRGQQSGDEVRAVNHGTAERPRYHVFGFLTKADQLRLPGGTFSRADRTALKDYFDRLAADGAEALTASRGWFGLTAKELAAVSSDLAQPIDFETKGQPPKIVLQKLLSKFANLGSGTSGIETTSALDGAAPVADELKGLTAGTGLAMMLRNYGLRLQPGKMRGQPVAYRMLPTDRDEFARSTLGLTEDQAMSHWPIGWQPAGRASDIVPALFEPRNAEIEGYTLEETLEAIGPRLKIPFYLDHAALRAARIDQTAIQVRLPRTRASYKRIIDRVLSQARLHSQIRVDEAGTPFLWITR